MKVASRPPLRRMFLYYHEILANHYPNARQLADRLEVNRRTVQRDLEFLQESCSWPLGFDHGRNGYYFTQPSFAFPPLRMTEGEVIALFLAERLMEQYSGTPYESDLRSLFRKVTQWLPEPIAVDVAGLAGSLSVVPATVTPHDLDRFQLLAGAALHGRQLEIGGRSQAVSCRRQPFGCG